MKLTLVALWLAMILMLGWQLYSNRALNERVRCLERDYVIEHGDPRFTVFSDPCPDLR